jgi:hypothetical protein
VLGDKLEEIDRLANAAAAPEVTRARRLLVECGRDLGRDLGRNIGREEVGEVSR